MCERVQRQEGWLSDSVQFRRSVVSDSLLPHGLQHARLPCPSPPPEACSDSCRLSWWCHPTVSSSVVLGYWIRSKENFVEEWLFQKGFGSWIGSHISRQRQLWDQGAAWVETQSPKSEGISKNHLSQSHHAEHIRGTNQIKARMIAVHNNLFIHSFMQSLSSWNVSPWYKLVINSEKKNE